MRWITASRHPKRGAASGKPATGQIRLTVANRGGAVEITLADDGGGLDPARLRAAAVRKGLLDAKNAPPRSTRRPRSALIFHPGFSTTAIPTPPPGAASGWTWCATR